MITVGPAQRRLVVEDWLTPTEPIFRDELDAQVTVSKLARDLHFDYLDAFPDAPSDDLAQMAEEDAAYAGIAALVGKRLAVFHGHHWQ